MTPSGRAPALELTLDPTRDQTRAVRAAVRSVFVDSMPAVTLQDLLTIVTELVSNAQTYGPGVPFRVSIDVDEDGRPGGEVQDFGRSSFSLPEHDVDPNGGLGLQIVDALAEEWGIASQDGLVWFRARRAED
jgi:two-component sensor histidine kinase